MARPRRRPIAAAKSWLLLLTEFVRPRRGRAFSLLLVGTNNLQPAALTRVDHETKAVQLYDRRHQIQPKADARRTSDLVGTVETPQHGLALLLADAGAGIGHAHDGLAVATQQLDIHLAAFGRKLDGIVDEIGDRLQQEIPVAAHVKPVSHVDPQADILVF